MELVAFSFFFFFTGKDSMVNTIIFKKWFVIKQNTLYWQRKCKKKEYSNIFKQTIQDLITMKYPGLHTVCRSFESQEL